MSYSASGAAAGDSVGNVAKVTAGDRPTERASGLGPTADNDDAVAQCGAVVPRTEEGIKGKGGSKKEAGWMLDWID